jgi:hypothetical protein
VGRAKRACGKTKRKKDDSGQKEMIKSIVKWASSRPLHMAGASRAVLRRGALTWVCNLKHLKMDELYDLEMLLREKARVAAEISIDHFFWQYQSKSL